MIVSFMKVTFMKTIRSPLAFPFALYFLVSFAIQLVEVPTVRLLESAICNRYYRSIGNATVSIFNDVDESSCKISVVQGQLANVVGWKMSFDAIPGISLS